MAEPTNDSLATLGWRGFFAAQIDPILEAELAPVRVTGVHRDTLLVAGLGADDRLPVPRADNEEAAATVGDWLLVDPSAHSVRRRLDRFGLFKRRAAGTDRRLQLIAANVDTLFIVTSANRDFNPARLERYLALALEGSANPVVIVTKADLNEEARDLAARAARLAPGLFAECLDARDPIAAEALGPWCATGQTVALVGSSGVGKSTLINTLTGAGQMVNTVREADQRGRHSTTARSMHRLTGGGWLIDTPGMRELKLVDATDSIDDVFAEITELATRCRFTDCEHDSEPGCAIRKALKSGALDVGRLERFRKLSAETRYNSESLAERRARFKSFGKLYKSVQKDKSARRRES